MIIDQKFNISKSPAEGEVIVDLKAYRPIHRPKSPFMAEVIIRRTSTCHDRLPRGQDT